MFKRTSNQMLYGFGIKSLHRRVFNRDEELRTNVQNNHNKPQTVRHDHATKQDNATSNLNKLKNLDLVCVFMISLIIYSNTIYGEFLHDDNPAILRNYDVQGKTSILDVFRHDFWGFPMISNSSHKSYRPFCVLYFRLEHYLFGFNAIVFHINNVLLHSLVSVIFTVLCNQVIFMSNFTVSDSRRVSVICGILFACHPIHTEAVANIVGRAEVLCAIFYLLSLLLHDSSLKILSSADKGNLKISSLVLDIYFLLSLLLSTCAMLSKESGITVLAIVFIREYHYFRTNFIELKYINSFIFSKCAVRTFLVLFWLCFMLFSRFEIMNWTQPVFAKPDNPTSNSSKRKTRFLTYLYITWVNFKLLVMPINLTYDWSYATIPIVQSIKDFRNVITFIFTTSWITLSFITLRSYLNGLQMTPMLYGSVMLIIPFIPASNLFFPVGFVVAERVLYLPSMGFVILSVIIWHKLIIRYHKFQLLLKLLLFLMLIFYCIKTFTRNEEWRTREKLFWSGVQTVPNNAKVRYNWANYLRDSGRYEEAVSEYKETLKLYPKYTGALNNLATILEMKNSTSKRAEELYIRLIRLEPNRVDAYRNLADLLLKKKRFKTAVDVYMRLFDTQGTYADHIISLAELLSKHNVTAQAERLFVRVLSQYCDIQNDPDIMKMLSETNLFVNNLASKLPGTCISNGSNLERFYASYARLKFSVGKSNDAMLLANRSSKYMNKKKKLPTETSEN